MSEKPEKNLAHRGPFSTPEEAQAFKPESEHFKLYQVTDPQGTVRYTWANGNNSALANVVLAAGWSFSVLGTVSKDKVAGMLAQLTPEERAALLAQYQEAVPAPAPEKAHGKKGK
jgi:hypothetical protein